MQSHHQCFIQPSQNLQKLSDDIQNLYFYGKTQFEDVLQVLISRSVCSIGDKYSEGDEIIRSFNLSKLSNIRNVVVANRIFMNMKLFTITNMNSLQSIEIDYHSFKQTRKFVLQSM